MSKIKKEEIEMQTETLATKNVIPLPTNEKKRLVQAEVNLELFEAVSVEIKNKNLKIRSVIEWGFQAFLLASNPKEAAKLGIK